MDFNLITPCSLHPGWGVIYQGGSPDETIRRIPGPLAIICMRENENYDRFIDHKQIHALLVHTIMDEPDAVLPDLAYFCLLKSAFVYLQRGVNLYVHCAAGHSRSSYLTVGLVSRALDLSVDDALSFIRQQRPSAKPNSGFWNHLKRLEFRLRRGAP